MTLLLISFIAGILTVLAPCILPLLPVIIGGSVSDTRSKLKPYVITASLAVSVVVFTLILKVSTSFIDIPQSFWKLFAGSILILFSITMIFPRAWAKLVLKFKGEHKANSWLTKASQKESFKGDILMGAALGPVFSSCSPTYFVILATVLPQSFAVGLINLIAYAVGLSLVLLLISLLGQRFVSKISGISDPDGWFKKAIGVLFLLVAIGIISGFDKKIEAYILDSNFFIVGNIENRLLENVDIK
ncbi:MAG: cytochrome c-type biogenesis protein [Candidatus Paceibacteria bacterium]|jgi:cytochrome c-type biogenesis protein